ncbi:(2Fe-2S)-binding protein [Ramlibacter sp. 2FC]|uniref:(2Fe-2S)-binding protein n=1 Tax=Ramlibacter sp. 2FC TaxID=2502188 RepID=UPI0024C27616|nr:(2Fe-2S)-binding protein [Ramlibacter sp. 2FC]
MSQSGKQNITLVVNGTKRVVGVESRSLLSDVLRRDLGLVGVHAGCEHGVCGACTVRIDGKSARSCITLAVQIDGSSVDTVEGLADGTKLHPVQEAFWRCNGLQCGFCTPGMLMRVTEFLETNPTPTREEAREAIASNLCRCTGYQHIIDSVMEAAARLRGEEWSATAGIPAAELRDPTKETR